ncbi:MAG: hypothetical protein KatS3mg023_0397 [Armatimonadota bacterium]|nr:MAG: hypothetical protein KatS3mg023_0397 [Armatimonadota bacterium]
MRDFLNLRDVARALGVCEATARKLLNSGELPSVYLGGRRRVPRLAFERWFEAMQSVEVGRQHENR